MRWWVGLAWGLVVLAGVARAEVLDPSRWPDADRRFLQAALVWSGDYVGLTDGDWGARSAAALEAWAAREAGGAARSPEALRPLLMPLVEEVWSDGWGVINLEDVGLSVALPSALLGPMVEVGAGLEARSLGDDLVFRVLFDDVAGTWAMHDWMAANHAGPEEFYASDRGDRMVSAATLGNGKRVYLRSALMDGFVLSMQVIAEPWQRGRLELIASTMQWGRAPDLWPAPGGPLDLMLSAEPPAASPPPAAVASAAPPAVGSGAMNGARARPSSAALAPAAGPPLATGTGFFVNNTDIVTAAHVIEGCGSLWLEEDGAALAAIAADPVLDLAVLSSARRSTRWLPLAVQAGPRLGEPVFALGFPYAGTELMADQGLSVTGGNVSALPRSEDAGARVMVSAPVQPGNSGGPLLGASGAVLGVVVSRADDLAVLDRTGTLPQNMNFVTPVGRLVPFLEGAGVLFPPSVPGEGADLSAGIPDAVQQAVVMIGCR